MERYALLRHLQHQRWLRQHMAPGQPLKAYVARHHQLAQAIGPVPALPASPPQRSVRGEAANPFQAVDLGRPSQEQPALDPVEGDSAAIAELESAQEMTRHERSNPTVVTNQRALSATRLLAQAEESTTVAPMPTVDSAEEERAVEQVQRQALQSEETDLPEPLPVKQEALAPNAPPLEALAPDAPTPSARREHQSRASQQELPGARRARIEERPFSAPQVSPMREKQPGFEGRVGSEASRRASQTASKTEVQRQAESEAAALFTSNTQDRSPREWFALLTQGERKQQVPDTLTQSALDPGSEQSRLAEFSSSAQLAPQAGRKAREARVDQFDRVAQLNAHPERGTQAIQPDGTTPAAAYSGNEPRPLQGHSLPSRSVQIASSERTSGARFIPAQQQMNSSPNRGDVEKTTASRGTADAEPISLSARQFLRPLVGFDPADARIHRGPVAARFADAQQADAVTVSDDVFLGAGHASDKPETLGLLAHELTHVARHHEPRSVPPILNGNKPATTAAQDEPISGRAKAVAEPGASLASADEEALAEQVERQVILRADKKAEAPGRPLPGSVEHTFMPQHLQGNGAQRPQANWGGLPAPWEPLPGWLASSSSSSERDSAEFVNQHQAQQSLPAYSASAGNGQKSAINSSGASAGHAQAAPTAQRAGHERSLHLSGEQTDWQEPAGEQQSEPEPDLDKLARQVYAVLKRRLDVEHRRLS